MKKKNSPTIFTLLEYWLKGMGFVFNCLVEPPAPEPTITMKPEQLEIAEAPAAAAKLNTPRGFTDLSNPTWSPAT